MNRIARSNISTPVVPRHAGARRLRAPNPLLLAAIAALLVSGSYSPSRAQTFYVERGNAACSNSGAGTEAQPYCTIAAALTARGVAGNTIVVKPGIYPEQVTINASGSAGLPITLRASASGVVIDGADDFTNTAQWTLLSGNVWLAAGVTWGSPRQVFIDGTRIDSSAVAVASLPNRTYRFVPGTGLYVNAGGGNPATHGARVGRRNYGFSMFGRSFLTIDGFQVTRTEDRGFNIQGNCTNITVIRNVVNFTHRMGIQMVGGSANVISANRIHDCLDHGIALITGATGCTIEDNESYNNAKPIDRIANGIYLFGCPGNTIRRNNVHHNEDSGIHIQSGSNNCISYLNRSWSNGDHGIDHLGATGTIHVNDVISTNFRDGISIEGTSTGTQVHDCITVNNGLTATPPGFNLWVDAASVGGFVSNYNVIWNSTAQAPVGWGSVSYPTVAAYSTASGQDVNTISADPRFVNAASGDFHLMTGSPAVDNANSGAPNWPTNDADNLTRFDNPLVANTGIGPIAYGDRGAYELRVTAPNQAPNGTINTPTTTTVTIVAGQSVNFTGTGTDSDNNLPLSFLWNFGGGATNSTLEDPGAVVFATAGTYTVSFTVTDALGLADPTPATRTITVNANPAPNGVINTPTNTSVTIAAGQSVNFTGTGTDSNNNLPLTFLWNFGGGATNSTVEDPGAVVFAVAGTYTVTFTVTDALGASDPTPATRTVTVTGNQPPNGVINTPTAAVTITAGQSVNFTGTGTDPNSNLPLTFAWNFGGGATNSTVEDPGNVVFASAGTFTVSFTVTDALGLADPTPDTRVITVTGAANQAPNGVIDTPTAATTIVAGQSVSFAGTGTDPDNNLPLTFAWNFGGGATNSTVEDPGNVVFATAGTYTVSFTVTDALLLADPTPDTRVITVTPAPTGCTNLVANPSFETDLTGWKGVGCTLARVAGGQAGGFAGRATGGANLSSFYAQGSTSWIGPTVAGSGYSFSTWVRSDLARGLVKIKVIEYLNGTRVGEGNSADVTLSAAWQQIQLDYTPVRTGSVVYLTVKNSPAAVSESFDLDNVSICPLQATPNQPPNGVINTPTAAVTIAAGQSVSFTGTGTDPDNHLPLTFAWNFGGGAPNTTVEDPGNVTFTAPGTFTVTFTVTDGLGLADPTPDTRVVTVTGTNQAPNGVINTPTGPVSIVAGQSVNFTGTGTDPNGNLPLVFLWNFGGGATNATVEDPGNVVFATPGTFTVTFTVTDALGLADPTPDSRVVTVSPASGGPCAGNLVLNPSFETDLLGWKGVGATLTRVPGGSAGGFAARVTGGASTSSFYVEGSKTWIVPAVAGSRYHFSAMVRSDLGRGLVRIKILEYLSGVRVGEGSSADVTLSAGWQQLQLDYTSTQANSIIYFTLKASPNSISESFDLDDASACPIIVAPSAAATLADGTEGALGGPVYIKPTVAPNPVAGMSKLMFSTSRPGPLHVAVYDVSGRQVRMLADESFAPAGLHALPLGNEGRARLESGVYFYRIRSVDGLAQGRFVVMK